LKQRPADIGKILSGIQKPMKAGPESLRETGEMITLKTNKPKREILISNLKKY